MYFIVEFLQIITYYHLITKQQKIKVIIKHRFLFNLVQDHTTLNMQTSSDFCLSPKCFTFELDLLRITVFKALFSNANVHASSAIGWTAVILKQEISLSLGIELRTAKFASRTKVYMVTRTVEWGYASTFIHVAHLFILTRHLQIKSQKYDEHFKMRKPGNNEM